MRIWIVTIGEPLPLPGARGRLYRSGVLAQMLADRGHDVTWVSSDFDHFAKEYHNVRENEVVLTSSYRLHLLHGPAYDKNVGFRRLLNHFVLGYRFYRYSKQEDAPDLIVCSLPILELSFVSVHFARRRQIPCLLDIRDLWPDIFADYLPKYFRKLMQSILLPLYFMKRYALRRARGLIGISQSYLDWALAGAGRAKSQDDRVIPLGYESRVQMDENSGKDYAIREKFGIDAHAFVVIFSGTFGRSYDLLTAVEAARLLEARGCPIRLLLCGDGETRPQIEQTAADVSNVTLTGWLDEETLGAALCSADAGLAAYQRFAPQSLPNKVFEYLSAGLPVISSLSGEARNLLETESCGLYYTPQSARELADAIQKLQADAALCREYSQNSQAVFRERYSGIRIFGEYVSFIETFKR